MFVIGILAIPLLFVSAVSTSTGQATAQGDDVDSDGDGVTDAIDVCPHNASGVAVD
jgi:hypothetical protein